MGEVRRPRWRKPSTSASVEDGELRRQEDERRKDADEILAHAKWLYEQHDKRSEGAQTRAGAVLAFTGTLFALAPGAIRQPTSGWELGLLGLVLLSALTSGFFCLQVLLPRTLMRGLPDRPGLRALAGKFDSGQPIPIPTQQFVTDILSTKEPDEKSPVDEAAELAAVRVRSLQRAYISLAFTFLVTGGLTFTATLLH